jgi:mannose-binding lectin 2
VETGDIGNQVTCAYRRAPPQHAHYIAHITMDITGEYKPSLATRTRRIYDRLTTKGKVFFGFIALVLLYLIFQLFGGSGKNIDSSYNNDSDRDVYDMNANGKKLSINDFNTISDLLNASPKANKVELTYLSLPPYLNSENKFPHYKNGGNMLLSRSADFVRLTKDAPKQSGHLFSHLPLSTDDLSAFEIELELKIHGNQEKQSMVGDGMAIWLTTDPLKQGDVFGMQGDFNGLGLFVDTYKNYNGKKNRNAFPYLSIQRNRGVSGYYDKSTDGINTQIGGCALHRLYNSENPSRLRLTYIRQANIFEVDVSIDGENNWRTCFRKENAQPDDFLPIGRPLYLGVSAETGELHHNVDLYSINARTYRYQDGGIISEIDSLGEGLTLSDTQEYDSVGDEDENNNNIGDNVLSTRRKKRKTLNRLRRQERKLKEMDKIKYGSEHGFVGWFFGLVWKFIKFVFYFTLVLLAAYAGVVGFRVYKEKQRKKSRGGLL